MTDTQLFSGLSCQFDQPISWEEIDPNKEILSSYAGNNFNRLQVIQGLEEASTETLEEFPGLAREIQRLDFKLNVLLELVGHIATKEHVLPPPSSILLNSEAIQWTSQMAPLEGSQVKIELFLDMRFPFPIVLSGRVDAVEPVQSGLYSTTVVLDKQGEIVQELMDKYIFRIHRRQIAQMKREGGTAQ